MNCVSCASKQGRFISLGNDNAICADCLEKCGIIQLNSNAQPKPFKISISPETLFYSRASAILDCMALYGEPLPYSEVAPLVGYHHRDRNFFELLGRSIREDSKNGKPLRASLVINKQTGIPGNSYFTLCRNLGYSIPLGKEKDFWLAQITKF